MDPTPADGNTYIQVVFYPRTLFSMQPFVMGDPAYPVYRSPVNHFKTIQPKIASHEKRNKQKTRKLNGRGYH